MQKVITEYPNRDLFNVTRDIPKDQIKSDTYTQIGSSMLDILRKRGGIGLSANQVGLPINMCVIELQSETYIILNPRVIKQSDKRVKSAEGCLSIPGAFLHINRHKTVTVEYEDVTGETKTIEADDKLSCCLQHEIDHLRGILMINRVNEIKKNKALKDMHLYKRRKRRYEKNTNS